MKNSQPNDCGGRILTDLQVIHDRVPRSGAMNMAVDEALLETATKPVLRFYGWNVPSLSFGYFGRFSDAAAAAPERALVRRWTGGGIVLHGADVTYSIILPRRAVDALPAPRTLYNQIHSVIRDALSGDLGVTLANEDAPKVSDACFANSVTADVLLGGRKIAGAAQRRTRNGLLHQGSIQYEALPLSFPETFAAALCGDFEAAIAAPTVIQRAQNLAEQKYETNEWLRRR